MAIIHEPYPPPLRALKQLTRFAPPQTPAPAHSF
jgi:hypothetical protein